MVPDIVAKTILVLSLLLTSFFSIYSSVSLAIKVQLTGLITAYAVYQVFPELVDAVYASNKQYCFDWPFRATILVLLTGFSYRYIQQKLRYARLNDIKHKYCFTDNRASFEDMTIEQAQDVERNMSEWEFPRLYMFAWVSDFLRTSTNPGVSRALVKSGHMVNADPMIEHERLQATIHLMNGFMAYPVNSTYHSLIIARINEHHHRYGTWINSDDVLYLIIHFTFAPASWIDRFGYRKLEAFEHEALWILWREVGVRMGVKYMPKTLEQAKEWRKQFEKTCRWREDANEVTGMAMLNEIIYSVPIVFKPFIRKLVASILDWDIINLCQMEKLGPSPLLRVIAYDVFLGSAWFIRNLSLPRLSAYNRKPVTNRNGVASFGHTPYDSLPFYQEQNFWNLWGVGAIVRRLRGFPMPSSKFYSQGKPFEAMGLSHDRPDSQAAVEKKVRDNAAILENAPLGFRPAIGYQYGRLIGPVPGPTYGAKLNSFSDATPIIPTGPDRFSKAYERRAPGYTNIGIIEKPEEVVAFDSHESYVNFAIPNNIHLDATWTDVAAWRIPR